MWKGAKACGLVIFQSFSRRRYHVTLRNCNQSLDILNFYLLTPGCWTIVAWNQTLMKSCIAILWIGGDPECKSADFYSTTPCEHFDCYCSALGIDRGSPVYSNVDVCHYWTFISIIKQDIEHVGLKAMCPQGHIPILGKFCPRSNPHPASRHSKQRVSLS